MRSTLHGSRGSSSGSGATGRRSGSRSIPIRATPATPAGRTALVPPYPRRASQGRQTALAAPPPQTRPSPPPLRGTSLPASLLDYSADLLPGGSDRPAPAPDVTFALGDTPA